MSALGSAIDELAGADLFACPVGVVGEDIVGLLSLQARLDAQIVRRIGHFDRHGGAEVGGATSTGAWLVGVGRMTRGAAFGRVYAARAFARGDLPSTAAAFADGRIGFEHVRALVGGVEGLDRELVEQAEPTLVEAAERLDPGRLRIVVERFRHRVDAGRHSRDTGPRDETRKLFASKTLNGMVAVSGLLTPLVGEALLLALDAASQPTGPEDTRTAAQRRHDGLYDLVRDALDTGRLPEMGGSRPQLVVHVPLDTLAAARRYGRGTLALDAVGGFEPAVLEHTGAVIDLATLCQLTDDAAISRLLMRGPSEILDHGRAIRTASPAQRRALAARDRGCVVCGRPPRWCEAHHLLPWEDGGLTDLANLCLLCRYHHGLLSRGWTLTGTPGHFTLYRPDGTAVRGPPAVIRG